MTTVGQLLFLWYSNINNPVIDFGKFAIIGLNPFIPVSAKTATSQVDLQVWKG